MVIPLQPVEYLTFRHFFVHRYGFMLEPLDELADNVFEIWTNFCSDAFIDCEKE